MAMHTHTHARAHTICHKDKHWLVLVILHTPECYQQHQFGFIFSVIDVLTIPIEIGDSLDKLKENTHTNTHISYANK